MPKLVFYFAFLVPLIVILITNFFAFCLVVHKLRSVMLRKKVTRAETQSAATQLRGAVSVLVLLGLTWCFGFFTIGGAHVVFSYLFVIFNTLQGLFIFVFYCVWKRDVQIAWMTALPCCPRPEKSSSGSEYSYSDNS